MHTVAGLAHMDIKPDNYVITDDGSFALIDFAFAVHAYEQTKSKSGTLIYKAPELFISGFACPIKADIFGLGVSIFIILFLAAPFSENGCASDKEYIKHFKNSP